ncbi:25323_t:CDS:2, partial [Dentiscutata erythropus]
ISPVFQMTQIAVEMTWEERQEKIESVRNIAIRNQIIGSVNYDAQTSSYERSEPSTINFSDSINVSMLDDNENNSKNITEEIDNKEDDTNENKTNISTLNTADRLNCHPADHKNSKIELQYLFSRVLTQPSFVRTIEQDIENIEEIQ